MHSPDGTTFDITHINPIRSTDPNHICHWPTWVEDCTVQFVAGPPHSVIVTCDSDNGFDGQVCDDIGGDICRPQPPPSAFDDGLQWIVQHGAPWVGVPSLQALHNGFLNFDNVILQPAL